MHKATSTNFPIALYSEQEVFIGVGKKRKSRGIKKVIVGYVCKKCFGKHKTQEFIKKHKIEAKQGQSMKEAIGDKIKKLRMKRPPMMRYPKPPEGTGWNKVKKWTKEKFFKPKGRE